LAFNFFVNGKKSPELNNAREKLLSALALQRLVNEKIERYQEKIDSDKYNTHTKAIRV